MHNSVDVWTRDSGWIVADGEAPYGYSVTRRTLDPIPPSSPPILLGVELLAGSTAIGLLGGDRPVGVVIEDREHERRDVNARLVVAADGRGSKLARWARVSGRVKPHGRFLLGILERSATRHDALEDVDARSRTARTRSRWRTASTVVLVAPHRERLPEFRADLHGAFRRMVDELPGGPDLDTATQESKLLGKLELPNVFAPHRARA